MCGQERRQARASRFFLAFDQNADSERKRSGLRPPGARGLDERHQLAFVVGGAPRDDDLAVLRIVGETRREGRSGPFRERLRGLHVVVTVEQYAAARLGRLWIARVPDHHWLARRGHDTCVESRPRARGRRSIPRRRCKLDDGRGRSRRSEWRGAGTAAGALAALPFGAGRALWATPRPLIVPHSWQRPGAVKFSAAPAEAHGAPLPEPIAARFECGGGYSLSCTLMACGPLPRRSGSVSKETRAPSSSAGSPERCNAEICKNTSLPPSSGVMKPNPRE